MAKMLRFRMILMAGFFVFFIAASGGGSEPLVSAGLLEHGKLKVVWENELPLKDGESLQELFVIGNRVYGLSDRNYMVSLNKETGIMVFGNYVEEQGFPIVGLDIYKGELFSVIGGKIAEIDPDVGIVQLGQRFKYGVVCPAVRNSSHYYVAGSDNRLHAVRSGDKG